MFFSLSLAIVGWVVASDWRPNATVLYPGVTHGPCLLRLLAPVQVTDCAGVTGVVSRQGRRVSVLSVRLRSLSRQL